MYSFPDLEPVCCSMSRSNCCFLACILISQEAGQVVWYSHLLKNFPQFVVIHTVKGFCVVNKAEVDVFLELSCFFDDPADVGNLTSGSSTFSKSSWTSGSILSITLQECGWVQLCNSLSILWHCLSLGLEWCGHCCVFQICWHIECSTFTASSFRIWNSSAGILALRSP